MKRRAVGVAVLIVLFATAGTEARDLWVGAGGGIVDPQGARSAPFFTGNLRFKLKGNLVLEPEVGYWKKTNATEAVETTLEDVSAGANVLYRVPTRRGVRFFVGAGLGLHLIRSRFAIAGFEFDSDTEAKQGMHFIAGFDFKVSGGLSAFGAARFDAVSDVAQNKAYGGLRLEL